MLTLKNVSKSFGTEEVLNNINLEIKDDEIVSILGKSGSGKTTLLNLILGILQPTSGEILYDDENITKVPMEKRGFNIVFQDYALFPHLNVRKNITYGLRNFPGISTPEEVDELIRFLDIEAHVDKKIHQLSGGQKQRVSIARTLVMKPRILLMDEPLSALDGVIKEQIKHRIQEIAKKYHLTTIIVTHDPEEALTVSDRVLILNQGKIEQFDTPAAIIANPSSKYVDDFILNQLRMKKANIDHLFNNNGQVVG